MKILTFVDIISAWGNAIKNKDKTEFEGMLSEDFVWRNVALEGVSSKAESLEWVMEVADFRIGDYKSLHDGEDVLVGTHTVTQAGRDETIVLCVVNISEDGNQVKMWSTFVPSILSEAVT